MLPGNEELVAEILKLLKSGVSVNEVIVRLMSLMWLSSSLLMKVVPLPHGIDTWKGNFLREFQILKQQMLDVVPRPQMDALRLLWPRRKASWTS